MASMASMTSSLYHFYHMGVDWDWRRIFDEHMQTLLRSGLASQLARIYLGMVGKAANRHAAKEYVAVKGREWGLTFEVVIEAGAGFEQATFNAMYEFAQQREGYILYAHTKGSYTVSRRNDRWRISMTYFLVERWQEAIAHLPEVEAVGSHWLDLVGYPNAKSQHFGGNFWWTTTAYLRTLRYCDHRDRYEAEFWIGKAVTMRVHDMNPGWMFDANFHAPL